MILIWGHGNSVLYLILIKCHIRPWEARVFKHLVSPLSNATSWSSQLKSIWIVLLSSWQWESQWKTFSCCWVTVNILKTCPINAAASNPAIGWWGVLCNADALGWQKSDGWEELCKYITGLMFHWRGKLFQGWVTTITYPVRRKINLPESTFRLLKNSYGNTAGKKQKKNQLKVVLPSNTLLFMVQWAVPPVLEMHVYFHIPFVVWCWYISKSKLVNSGSSFKQYQTGLLRISLTPCLQRPLLQLPPMTVNCNNPAAAVCGQCRASTGCIYLTLST